MPKRKPNNRPSSRSGGHLPALVDLNLIKGLAHPLRQHILLAAVAEEVSPTELSKALDEGLSQVSYHVKVLRDDCDGLVEEVRTEPRRGAMEHYYRANAKTLLPAKAWRGLKKGLRAAVGAGLANDLLEDLAGALKAGKLQGADDHLSRTPLMLDAPGRRMVKQIAERASKDVEKVQREVAKRRAEADGNDLLAYVFALFAFEPDWDLEKIRAIEAEAQARLDES
jgi:DNA-binding transcriptional ArsR family regulator